MEMQRAEANPEYSLPYWWHSFLGHLDYSRGSSFAPMVRHPNFNEVEYLDRLQIPRPISFPPRFHPTPPDTALKFGSSRDFGRTKSRHFEGVEEKSRQRLECVCLSTAFGGAMPNGCRQQFDANQSGDESHALQTLERQTSHPANRPVFFRPTSPQIREEPKVSSTLCLPVQSTA